MGSAAAASSINRVMEAHSDELAAEAAPHVDEETAIVPGTLLTYLGTQLEGQLYSIAVMHTFRTETGQLVTVDGEPLDIDDLAERFPDCEVGY